MNQLKNVIVSGATGFIGNHLVNQLLEKGIYTVAIIRKGTRDKLRAGSSELLHVAEYDGEDISIIKQSVPNRKYDAFFHLSWEGVAGVKRADYKMQLRNVERSIDFLKIASELECSVFIGSSSIREVECAYYAPIDDVCLPPRFIYSSAKVTTHYMSKCLAQKWGISYINAVIGNVFGEFGDDNLIVHDTIIKLLRGEQTAYTDATQIVDFVYVKDIVYGLILLAQAGKENRSYYIGSSKPLQLKEYLKIINNLINPQNCLGIGKRPPDGASMLSDIYDISKINRDTGYLPKHTFNDAIKKTIDWYKDTIV